MASWLGCWRPISHLVIELRGQLKRSASYSCENPCLALMLASRLPKPSFVAILSVRSRFYMMGVLPMPFRLTLSIKQE